MTGAKSRCNAKGAKRVGAIVAPKIIPLHDLHNRADEDAQEIWEVEPGPAQQYQRREDGGGRRRTRKRTCYFLFCICFFKIVFMFLSINEWWESTKNGASRRGAGCHYTGAITLKIQDSLLKICKYSFSAPSLIGESDIRNCPLDLTPSKIFVRFRKLENMRSCRCQIHFTN